VEETVVALEVKDMKAVFARVEARDVIAARARIGGTLIEIAVTEGSAVKQGQRIALVADDKLALQLGAADARIRALESELANARTELGRARDLLSRGAGTQQRVDQLRTQTEVLENQVNAARADRGVIVQQTSEGQVLSPATGRVIKVPARSGVVMPGETIAMIAGGGFFLRLAIPERHAPLLKQGATVAVLGTSSVPAKNSAEGKLVKIFPQIENGRVIADVEVQGLSDYFTGERILVRVPVAARKAITVPPQAVVTRSGIDFLRIKTNAGEREIAVVPGGMVNTSKGERLEILSGLFEGDEVILP
jgi:RND family efflux transporter MFP subunit